MFQVIQIEVPLPDKYATRSSLRTTSDDIEELLKTPDAVITEFPIVYAAIGETATNDQTEPISSPKTYKPTTDTNGVVSVVYSNEIAKVGRYVEMTLKKVENDCATCDLWFYAKSLAGMQKYEVASATETQACVTAALPIFKKWEVKTTTSLSPGMWLNMGGLISEKVENRTSGKVEKTRIIKASFVRILPPSTDK